MDINVFTVFTDLRVWTGQFDDDRQSLPWGYVKSAVHNFRLKTLSRGLIQKGHFCDLQPFVGPVISNRDRQVLAEEVAIVQVWLKAGSKDLEAFLWWRFERALERGLHFGPELDRHLMDAPGKENGKLEHVPVVHIPGDRHPIDVDRGHTQALNHDS